MKLYHKELLEILPRLQLLQLHRECCRIRTNGWGKSKVENHFVFRYGLSKFYNYHLTVLAELNARGYKVNMKWATIHYRGRETAYQDWVFTGKLDFSEYHEQNSKVLKKDLKHLLSLFKMENSTKIYPLEEQYRVLGFITDRDIEL